ncbi:MAG TPA: enoyl-CoA hydratase/isomerase family protein [Pirellulales bacterium]|jgi:enoyl-CoA hydratase/carnithine racemase|nr:enoyl-CoA hydratase/isomerase family protein [Pirellulales bacterium]
MNENSHPPSSAPLVKVHVHGAAGTIILNRPEKRNSLSRALLAELAQAFADLHQQRRVRAVILTATGSTFCAGMDLAEMAATSRSENSHTQWHQDAVQYHDLIETMLQFPKPIIAAVAGPALAGGAGLMLACDIVVAGNSATFGLPEPKRGLVAGIVAPLVAFRAGAGRAGYLLLTAKTIGAEEAFRYGLVHELVDDDKVWARAVEIANHCAAGAPEALQLTKRMLNETVGEHLGSELSAGAAASATARTTEAAAEGLAAFLEKRPPVWP